VPLLAPRFGREKIRDSDTLAAHSFLYPLMNRNYAVPALHRALHDMGKSLGQKHPGIRLTYLDANFPFLDGFPLFPHLSHHDGKKVDVSFIYEEENGEMTDRKPSGSGYGAFSGPLPGEFDQAGACEAKGYWQYGCAAYLTLGRWGAPLRLSEAGTRGLVQTAAGHPAVGKIFLEPHLQSRLGLRNGKIRFHGCHAVRHDDHLHVQLR
jgi:hypothetical protein